MSKYSKYVAFILIFSMTFVLSLPSKEAFASPEKKQEVENTNREMLFIGAVFVVIGVYIGYLAINDSNPPSKKTSVKKTEIPASVTARLQPIQIASPTTKFSKISKTINKFLAANGRQLPDSAAEVEIANNFLEIFSIKGLLTSLRSAPDSDKVFEVIPTDFAAAKSGLIVHIRHYSEWVENLPDKPIVVGDKNLDSEFFSALKKIASFDRESAEWPNDCLTVYLFLKAISYKAELSYYPETKAGEILNSFLLSEYDFLRSEKWRNIIFEFKNDY